MVEICLLMRSLPPMFCWGVLLKPLKCTISFYKHKQIATTEVLYFFAVSAVVWGIHTIKIRIYNNVSFGDLKSSSRSAMCIPVTIENRNTTWEYRYCRHFSAPAALLGDHRIADHTRTPLCARCWEEKLLAPPRLEFMVFVHVDCSLLVSYLSHRIQTQCPFLPEY